MAYLSSQRETGFSLSGMVSNAVAGVKAAIVRRAVYNRTLAELNGLSDRDLADLGIHRVQIAEVASQAAYHA